MKRALLACLVAIPGLAGDRRAAAQQFERSVAAMDRVLQAWLPHADPRTLLLPDRVPGGSRGRKAGDTEPLYTPHNSGADLYPYLILTAHLTAPPLYHGRMMEMLRNEIRYTNARGQVPGNLALATGALGPPSLFGAGEYAKDGLITVTEYLGRTPWFYRMVDMIADAMSQAPVETRFGALPSDDAELNGDFLQVLPRLYRMTGEGRFLEWSRRIADAYVEEILPASDGLPPSKWDFRKHAGDGVIRLRDHGNETVVGLVLHYLIEHELGSPRATRYRPVIERMLDRILLSANPDGLLYDEVNTATLKPTRPRLADTWGYIYGAMYAFYQATGASRYRDATRRVLGNLPKYRGHDWENGSFDGYADAIEGALYLVNREPVPEALDWIDSETGVMAAMQQPSGHIEHWYGEGNFNRTLMLYALWKSQGCRPDHWSPGVGLGATRDGERLRLLLQAPAGWKGKIQFDYARHHRFFQFRKNWVRLNEFPEWYTVAENTLYRLVSDGAERVRLGSELIAGVSLAPGDWTIEPLR